MSRKAQGYPAVKKTNGLWQIDSANISFAKKKVTAKVSRD